MTYKYPERTSEKYYAYGYWMGSVPSWVEIRGIPVEIPGLAGYDLFASRGYDAHTRKARPLRGGDWDIYEGKTGCAMRVQDARTPEEAVAKLQSRLEYHKANAAESMDKSLESMFQNSPRYSTEEGRVEPVRGDPSGLEYYKTLTVKELRRRQRINDGQMEAAYKQRNEIAMGRLEADRKLLDQAVDWVAFEKPKRGKGA